MHEAKQRHIDGNPSAISTALYDLSTLAREFDVVSIVSVTPIRFASFDIELPNLAYFRSSGDSFPLGLCFRGNRCHTLFFLSGQLISFDLSRIEALIDLPLQLASFELSVGNGPSKRAPDSDPNRLALIQPLEDVRRLACRRRAQAQTGCSGVP
ncbi:hypothetical protein APR50_02505 [Variovorax paradoxus]|nr:hypothetical protein APR52_12830 [Variovorax paradoxus]KPV11641.1 hypothetical protein APR50_02505 [Variovorax paradoxus]KPV13268.1 hypothetical protein APR49_03575 [Variovorax paradoxus]KPV20965.1 hypothetical protein APR48_38345 [Variovorax paradoxus]KPV21542.1 hypothetical protein APR51_13510 [Variovorax paradoxus]